MPGADSETGPDALRKAHSLSADAHTLLDSPSSTLVKLRSALAKYQTALGIYESTAYAKAKDSYPTLGAGAGTGAGTGASARPWSSGGSDKTLDLLVSQHRRLIRDVERKIEAAERVEAAAAVSAAHAGIRSHVSVPGPSLGGGVPGPSRVARRVTDPHTSTSIPAQNGSTERKSSGADEGSNGGMTSRLATPGVGLASLAHPPPPSRPGFMASRTSFTSSRGLPPFARPPAPAPALSTTTPSPLPPSHAAHRHVPPGNTVTRTLSPLYSMHSSTSSSEPGESFISVGPHGATRRLGAGTGTGEGGSEQDPFNRFWAMLDGALDNISRPVAFASAPIGREGVDVVGLEEGLAGVDLRESICGDVDGDGGGEGVEGGREGKAARRPASPSESFYLIPPHPHPSHAPSSTAPSQAAGTAISSKTPEELTLENTNLRASLDALAVHTSHVEKENAALRRGIKGREDLLRSVVGEVRQEAEKARIDQSILASQHLSPPPARHADASARTRIRHTSSASTIPTLASTVAADPRDGDGAADGGTDRQDATHPTSAPNIGSTPDARIAELEAQLTALRTENDKQAAQIQKYKERFERIKANARAKRDAKEA